MAQRMVRRPRIEGGTIQLPRTRTSRVPARENCCQQAAEIVQERVGHAVPSRASSKQWLRSQWLVKMTTLWPRFCRPTAASTTRRSAPPMPRSGWKKTTVLWPSSFSAMAGEVLCRGENWGSRCSREIPPSSLSLFPARGQKCNLRRDDTTRGPDTALGTGVSGTRIGSSVALPAGGSSVIKRF